MVYGNKETFPPLNGPFAIDTDDSKVTDYSIGRDVIYAGFAWSEAEAAYRLMIELAAKHQVGFFDASGSGDILIPGGDGSLQPLNANSNGKNPWWKVW